MDDACATLIILGRPFFATGGVCIGLTKGTILFRVWSEIEELDVCKNVHTQLLNHDKTRLHSLEACSMISREEPLVCPKELELNDKPSAKEKEGKKGVESTNKIPIGKESDCCLKGEFIIFHPTCLLFSIQESFSL